jgi:hypothetical protein
MPWEDPRPRPITKPTCHWDATARRLRWFQCLDQRQARWRQNQVPVCRCIKSEAADPVQASLRSVEVFAHRDVDAEALQRVVAGACESQRRRWPICLRGLIGEIRSGLGLRGARAEQRNLRLFAFGASQRADLVIHCSLWMLIAPQFPMRWESRTTGRGTDLYRLGSWAKITLI